MGSELRPIPWTSIHNYFVRYGNRYYDGFEKFETFIRMLDFHHRKLVRENPPKPPPTPPIGGKGKTRSSPRRVQRR